MKISKKSYIYSDDKQAEHQKHKEQKTKVKHKYYFYILTLFTG